MVEAKKDEAVDPTKKNWADEDDDQEDDDDNQEVPQLPGADEKDKDDNKEEEPKQAVKNYVPPVKRERNEYGDFIVTSINIREPEIAKVNPDREETDSDDDDDDDEEENDEADKEVEDKKKGK